MRKISLVCILLLTVQLFAGQVVTVSKSVSDLETQYDWKHDSTYLSFQLDDAITVTGTVGNAKYCSDNTAKSMRYYQGCRKGEFAIEALPGAMIQSIKLTYYVTKSNSVATTDYGTDGKNIPAANQVKNNETFPVNANRITLYVGRSTNETDGQIRITAFEVTYVLSGSRVVSCTTQELATRYGWGDLTCPRTFDLNEVIAVDVDSAGTMKYTMNTKQFHCYQWLGGFTIRAKEGCTIQSVRLTYASINAGVMTQNWGKDGKQIPVADRIASGQVVEVNGSSVTFYVGTTDTVVNGQIRISKWEVVYQQEEVDGLMLRSTTDLGKQFGWADAYCPVHIPFNNAISFHSDKTDNVKYYSTTRSFHCYQWSGGFYFKARTGTLIKSVALTYDALNDGVLIQNWGTDGKHIPEEDWIESGATVSVNSDSVHFFTGNKDTTKNCQIHITGFTVVYMDTLAHTETFGMCDSVQCDTTLVVAGDRGLFTWKMRKFQRNEVDFVGCSQGTRLLYEGAIAADSVLEGGVKDVSFDWRASDSNQPVHFIVRAGDTTVHFHRANPGSSTYTMNYTRELAVKKNCAFSISLGQADEPAQTQPIIGPISITPYLLFNVANHVDTINTNREAYDLKSVLINNIDEITTYEVVSNFTGDSVAIVDGVVDLSTIQHGGAIRVKASCFGGAVYTTLTLVVQIAPRVLFAEPNKVVLLGDTSFVNPLIAPDSIGAVTYSSSDTKVAMVNDTGLVSIVGLGQTTITAHVAASERYVATEASYRLSVIYNPEEGTYRLETFSQCRKKKVTSGFAYVEGDDAVYDWNLSNFSRDKQDTIAGEQGILLYYGGSIASNGEQEGGVKYLSFPWRSADPVSPVSFVINMANRSELYSQPAVGDADAVMTYSCLFSHQSNTAFSIHLQAKENPAQSRITVGPISIVPYVLFTNKYVELELPQTSYDCASAMINNTEAGDTIVYAILADPSGKASLEGSVLDLSAITEAEDIQLKATWGDVSTTMTVHLTVPTGLVNVNGNENGNRKVMKDGELWIWRDGKWWTVLGNEK